MDKKVAVLISGIYPAYLHREDLKNCLERTERIFKGCDFYYQTWDVPLYRHIFKAIDRDIHWAKEPDAFYNPYILAKEKYFGDKPGIQRLSKAPKTDTQKQLVMRACFQHLGFSSLYSQVPKKYDFYIRTRWDAYFNNEFPLQEILQHAEDNVIGMATVRSKFKHIANMPELAKKFKHIDGKDNYKRIAVRRQAIKNFIDRGLYCLNHCEASNVNHPAYENFLSDFCIIFKESDYEVGFTEREYEKQTLAGAEFGWHEMFCSKRSHINIHGLVAIMRNIDTSYKTYLKLKNARLL